MVFLEGGRVRGSRDVRYCRVIRRGRCRLEVINLMVGWVVCFFLGILGCRGFR